MKSPWYPAIPINLSWYSPSYFLREDYVHMVLSKNSVPQNPSVNHHLPYHLTAINLGILPAQFSGTTPKSYSRIYIYIYIPLYPPKTVSHIPINIPIIHPVDIQNYPSHQVINHHDLSHDLSHYSSIDKHNCMMYHMDDYIYNILLIIIITINYHYPIHPIFITSRYKYIMFIPWFIPLFIHWLWIHHIAIIFPLYPHLRLWLSMTVAWPGNRIGSHGPMAQWWETWWWSSSSS